MTSPSAAPTALERYFKHNPHRFTLERFAALRNGKLTKGLSPVEAMLTGELVDLQVTPDLGRWPKEVSPTLVAMAQTETPDDSRIFMILRQAKGNLVQAWFEGDRLVKLAKG